jgi:hypothetical protein
MNTRLQIKTFVATLSWIVITSSTMLMSFLCVGPSRLVSGANVLLQLVGGQTIRAESLIFPRRTDPEIGVQFEGLMPMCGSYRSTQDCVCAIPDRRTSFPQAELTPQAVKQHGEGFPL